MKFTDIFSYFLKLLGVAAILLALYRIFGYHDILRAMWATKDTSSLSALIPLGIELVVLTLFSRLFFWLSTK